MIDFSKIEQYRENNRIEAKKALGGLPRSVWETYSAFANTYGGIILLGVEELADKSFCTVDLPAPEKLIKEFWDIVNNPNKTSVNVLSSKDVFVQEVDGDHIVVINVPRAERSYKPVYVDGNPLNTYRRNGEGDYRCTREEYQAMVRDASVKTQDMLVLDEMDVDVFNQESVRSYRQRMRLSRPGHVWEALEDEDFLLKLGAVGCPFLMGFVRCALWQLGLAGGAELLYPDLLGIRELFYFLTFIFHKLTDIANIAIQICSNLE